jgi:hypothetical protein
MTTAKKCPTKCATSLLDKGFPATTDLRVLTCSERNSEPDSHSVTDVHQRVLSVTQAHREGSLGSFYASGVWTGRVQSDAKTEGANKKRDPTPEHRVPHGEVG